MKAGRIRGKACERRIYKEYSITIAAKRDVRIICCCSRIPGPEDT